MKKLFALLTVFTLSLTLVACGGAEELPAIPEDVDMETVDDYLGRPDVQYVDLRNFDDKMSSGYIEGFEFIPFFDYLEATDVLVRTDMDWEFAADDIKSEGALKELFQEDKTIFLMCGSGTRAGYVLAALESLGYENVINVGGIADYTGDNLVTGDGYYNLEVQLPIPNDVNMTNVDVYLGRGDVQYVDLRNFDDKMSSGYVEGFEFIPFFDYLEYENILVRTDGDWEFAAEDIQNEGALRALFAEDKTIFLMCGSGTRAGYVKAALDSLGYNTVLNIGGIADYAGDALVFGDGSYNINMDVKGDYTPGTYFGFDPVGKYMATVVINEKGGIADVMLDAMDSGTTKQNLGFDYGMVAYANADYEWFEHANMIADTIVANQGWDGIVLNETAINPAWNAQTVPHHFIEINNEESVDGVANATIGAEGFVLAWNAAISQASESNLGVVDIDATPAEWAAAHEPAYNYVDGQYTGQEDTYFVTVTVEDGFIVDAFIDALDCTDDNENGEFESCTSKQTLKFDYGMVAFGGADLEWFEQANLLAEALVEEQAWVWTVTEDGYFDQAALDSIGGVTIHVDTLQLAVEDALNRATTE
ncbi:MAG: hypothetical protein K9L74_06715 [Candidatus Izimaplasma sp.]|nr:hypothetical protein [Candidatus Izimaplasma bacterium]